MKLKYHVEWVPTGVYGDKFWWANCFGSNRGYVMKTRSGIYTGHAVGSKHFRGKTLKQVARRVVAHINNIYPSQLPR